ncbi:MAG: cupin domain-containing protein [Phenylobacterium sp.]
MEINADFTIPAVVHAAAMPWVASPMPGVERRMLDRVGDEIARATSIVRYAPGARFSPHVHGGGEEILVLEGVFQDEHGDYPAGAYVRNPPGSAHQPRTEVGATILVKLWQFDPHDRTTVRLDTAAVPKLPFAEGAWVQPLHLDARESVSLQIWAPHAHVHIRSHEGLEAFVLEGGFEEAGEAFARHSWLRLPPGHDLEAAAGPRGARLWIKTGHLGP